MRHIIVAIALAISSAVPVGTASATADEHASCLGIAFSEHGPAREVKTVVHDEAKPLADALDVPLGRLVSAFAHAHLGTHAACEGAVPEP